MRNLLRDIRCGFRLLFKLHFAFSSIVILTIALGTGVNTAIFNLLNSILLRPLPYENPNQILLLHERNASKGVTLPRVSPANFLDWKDQSQVFDQMAALRFKTFLVKGSSEPEWVSGGAVSASLFPLLGIKPELGQTFSDTEADRSNVVISHALWQRLFGADPEIIGKSVIIDDKSCSISAVMPSGFDFPRKFDLWVPLVIDSGLVAVRQARFFLCVARLKDNIGKEDAQAQMDAVARQLETAYPNTNAGWGVKLVPLTEQVIGKIGTVLLTLFGAATFVLLIACANVAGLLLAHTVTRSKEIAIRTALGAGKFRIIQQILTENFLLVIMGALLGLLLTFWLSHIIVAFSPEDFPRRGEVKMDWLVIVFTLLIAVITTIVSGLIPSLTTWNSDLSSSLKEGGKASSKGFHRQRLLSGIVVFEIAVALVLLAGAGLIIKTLWGLQKTELGFNASNVLTIRLNLPDTRYGKPDQQAAFFRQALQDIAVIPGVEESGAITELPIGGANGAFQITAESDAQLPADDKPTAFSNAVSSDYFRTMGISLLRGRHFTEKDQGEQSPKVIIIDQTVAQRFWPNEDPVGKHLTVLSNKPTSYEILGVVQSVKYQALDLPNSMGAIYVSYLQLPQSRMTMVVRSNAEFSGLEKAVHEVIRRIDKDQPISEISSMEQHLSESLTEKRFYALLMIAFAVLGLFQAAIGVYGVISYLVAQRRREIGIRVALGAQKKDILKVVFGRSLFLIAAGIVIGLIGAFTLTRFLSSLLYNVTPTDPFTFSVVVVILLLTAILACYIPARKAMNVDPMLVLKSE